MKRIQDLFWVFNNVSMKHFAYQVNQQPFKLDASQPLRLGDQAIWFLPGSWDACDFQGSSPRSVKSQGLKVPAAVFQSQGLHGKKCGLGNRCTKKTFKKHQRYKPCALGETFAAKNVF